jgi:hypothetical protein
MREKVAGFLGQTPLLFLGIVLGIAVGFRLLIGALSPSPSADVATTAASVPHEAPSASAAGPPRPEPAAGAIGAAPLPTTHTVTPPAPARRKPRIHGRR